MRAESNVAPNKMCHIQISFMRDDLQACVERNQDYFEKLAHVENIKVISISADKPDNAVASVVTGMELYMELSGLVDVEKERAKILKTQETLEKDIKRASGKLTNQGFLAKAPAAVIEKEKAKLEELQNKMKSLEERLAFLAKL